MRTLVLLTAAIIALTPVVASAQVSQPERDALIAIYYATGGPNWHNNTGWLGPAGTECTWVGVSCLSSGGEYWVNSLFMYTNNMVGDIPPEIGNLTALESLQFSQNLLQSLPPEIGNLGQLSYLDARGNLFTALPSTISGLTNLRYLNVTENQLQGIPDEIGALTQLRDLRLAYNLVSNLPSTIGDLTRLNYFDARGNHLSGLPPEIGNLINLQYLGLSDNEITSLPLELAQLQVLERLNLDWNRLEALPSDLSNLLSLLSLTLDHNLFSSFPLSLLTAPELGSVDLSWNRIDEIPAEIGTAVRSLNLELDSNKIVGFPAEYADSLVYIGSCKWNGIYTDDPEVWAKLSASDPTWWLTQTVPPLALSFSLITDTSLMMEWWPIDYAIDPGGFEVLFRQAPSGPWVSAGWTPSKYVIEFPVTGLTPETTYDVAVRSFTFAHPNNANHIVSDMTVPVMATTSNSGCEAPAITQSGSNPTILTAPGGAVFYLWNTGQTTQSITVQPVQPTWYWVNVYDGGCQETASILVADVALFADGFEYGDTSAWSATVP